MILSSGGMAMSGLMLDQSDGISKEIILEIISALKSIRYGSVEVVIHNSKIVQIEKKEVPHRSGKTKGGR